MNIPDDWIQRNDRPEGDAFDPEGEYRGKPSPFAERVMTLSLAGLLVIAGIAVLFQYRWTH